MKCNIIFHLHFSSRSKQSKNEQRRRWLLTVSVSDSVCQTRIPPKFSAVGFSPSPLATPSVKHAFPPKFIQKKQRPSNPRIRCSNNTTPQQQLNLSVLRFTLGIPGLDESYLPRYIGYAFRAVLVLNHFVGSDSSGITPAQLRTEALGLSLSAFSAVVPYLGKFLKGATPTDQKNIPEGSDIADNAKEDLAWGSYVLLRNTNAISLVLVQDALCVRGYWNTPKDLSKENVAHWFRKQIHRIGLSDLKDVVYFQQADLDSELKEMVPSGTRSLLVQPILDAPRKTDIISKGGGFVLLASSIDYAFTDKDKAWIAAIANKFRETSVPRLAGRSRLLFLKGGSGEPSGAPSFHHLPELDPFASQDFLGMCLKS